MTWADQSGRDLPADWPAIRQRVLTRDGHRCTWKLASGKRCPRKATDVDHINDPNEHGLHNLRALCGVHHGRRTARQGHQAREARRKARWRPRERHPGDLR